jgi:succinyl-CoA synthetase beta subunit
MDVRPVASRDQVAEGFRLLLTDARVSVVLVIAMGGGILRCDTIAEGLAAAIRRTGSPLPVVYHAAGTGKEISEMVLRNQGFAVTLTDSIEEAAHEALRISRMRAV